MSELNCGPESFGDPISPAVGLAIMDDFTRTDEVAIAELGERVERAQWWSDALDWIESIGPMGAK